MDLAAAQERLVPIRTTIDSTLEWWPDSPMIPALQAIVASMELLLGDVATALVAVQDQLDACDARVAALEPPPDPPAEETLE